MAQKRPAAPAQKAASMAGHARGCVEFGNEIQTYLARPDRT
jgi:hypothetical protein